MVQMTLLATRVLAALDEALFRLNMDKASLLASSQETTRRLVLPALGTAEREVAALPADRPARLLGVALTIQGETPLHEGERRAAAWSVVRRLVKLRGLMPEARLWRQAVPCLQGSALWAMELLPPTSAFSLRLQQLQHRLVAHFRADRKGPDEEPRESSSSAGS